MPMDEFVTVTFAKIYCGKQFVLPYGEGLYSPGYKFVLDEGPRFQDKVEYEVTGVTALFDEDKKCKEVLVKAMRKVSPFEIQLKAVVGFPLVQADVSPVWWASLNNFLRRKLATKVERIDAKSAGEEDAGDVGDVQFQRFRGKVARCAELVASNFAFPDLETATLFMTSWFVDNAKVILQGIPGSGKTTLIESSTMAYASEKRRYKDAILYYSMSKGVTLPDAPCPCGSSAPFGGCCMAKSYSKYRIGDKVVDRFTSREYLNMYRKEWARCPECGKPAGSDDVVDSGMGPAGMLHYIRCSNIYECDGIGAVFEHDNVREKLSAEVRPMVKEEDYNFNVNRRIGRRAVFDTLHGACKFREVLSQQKCRACGKDIAEIMDEVRVVETAVDGRKEMRFAPLLSAGMYGPTVIYEHLVHPETDACPDCASLPSDNRGGCVACAGTGRARVTVFKGRDILRVKKVGSPAGFLVDRYTNSAGYVFSVSSWDPILGVAKITPKKRPEEIFYYTKIEKEIEQVEEGRVSTRERFVMPPAARPIVPANVKFINECNRMRNDVQDEILGLLEEGEVEYKGVSFYTNTPCITFFDLNPHKEQKDVVLDWAFYDRLDLNLVLPTLNFGSKAEILMGGESDVRLNVFTAFMLDSCKKCHRTFPRWPGWDHPPERRSLFTAMLPRCPNCGPLGEADLERGAEPLFVDELASVRDIVKNIGLTQQASIFLSILSDIYGRSYFRYMDTHAMFGERQKRMAGAPMAGGAAPPCFVDQSTVQWWGLWSKAARTGIDTATAKTQGVDQPLDSIPKLFMSPTAGGVARPLGFRVSKSVEKVAKARAWFLTMTRVISNPTSPKRGELPRMRMIELADLAVDIKKMKDRLLRPWAARREGVPRMVQQQLRALDKMVCYRLDDCPDCGRDVSDMKRGDGKPLGLEDVVECPDCHRPFSPVFRIEVRPDDILMVFPYCASMRFCAEYSGANIPTEIYERFPNMTEWLKHETQQFMTNTDTREAWQNFAKALVKAFEACVQKGPKDAIDEMSGVAGGVESYPYMAQLWEYLWTRCSPDRFSPRSTVDSQDSFVARTSNWDEKRPKEAWDREG